MAQKTETRESATGEFFTRANHLVIGIGLIVVIIGFYALARMPVYGFVTMYIAPVLLVGGFLVIIPIGILKGGSKKTSRTSSGD